MICFHPLAGKQLGKVQLRKKPVKRKLEFPSPCGEVVRESWMCIHIQTETKAGFHPLAGKQLGKVPYFRTSLNTRGLVSIPLRGSSQGKTQAGSRYGSRFRDGFHPLAGKQLGKVCLPEMSAPYTGAFPSPCGEVVRERQGEKILHHSWSNVSIPLRGSSQGKRTALQWVPAVLVSIPLRGSSQGKFMAMVILMQRPLFPSPCGEVVRESCDHYFYNALHGVVSIPLRGSSQGKSSSRSWNRWHPNEWSFHPLAGKQLGKGSGLFLELYPLSAFPSPCGEVVRESQSNSETKGWQ